MPESDIDTTEKFLRLRLVVEKLRFLWQGPGTLWALACLVWAHPLAGEIIYDNTSTRLNVSHVSSAEFGDEIILAGGNRVVTNFVFALSPVNLSGNEQARVRFYLNDGPPLQQSEGLRPNTIIYDSGLFPIPQNAGSLVAVPRLKVLVPNRLTWSILFVGPDVEDGLGLEIYSPPPVGGNFTDFWEKSDSGWILKVRLDVPSTDFGARMEATGSIEDNTAPFISLIRAQIMDQDTSRQVSFSIGDFETRTGDLAVTLSSSNPTLIPNENLTLTGLDANRDLLIRPAPDQSGNATVQVTVRDGNGWVDAMSFAVQVNAVNQSPTIGPLTDQVVAEDTPTPTLDFTLTDRETPSSGLVVSGFSSDPGLVPAANIIFGGEGPNRTVRVTPAANQFGVATITVIVADGTGGTASRSFLLTIQPVNDEPAISELPAPTILEDTETLPLTFTVSDIETPAAGLVLSGSSSNPVLVPDADIVFGGEGPNRTVRVTPAANQFGVATITVMVVDGTGGTASRSFLLTIEPVNDLPRVSSIADHTTLENTPTQAIPFSVEDIETSADSLILVLTSQNTLLIPNQNILLAGNGMNRTLVLTPATGVSGTAVILISVDDGNGGLVQKTFVLTVLPQGSEGLPQITVHPASRILALGANAELTVGVNGIGPFTYQWRLNGAIIPGATGPTHPIPVFNLEQAGEYQVSVGNAFGVVDSQTALLLPAAVNSPLTDNFNVRPTVNDLARIGTSSNVDATFEAGEPSHARKAGGRSMWLRWIAPDSGIVTFRTTGSTFDTLLAVYRGENLNDLSQVVSDDDQGGYFTSQLAFNAVAGQAYQIAVDGFAASTGTIILSWGLEVTAELAPVIVTQPQSQTVPQGGSVTFVLTVQNLAGLAYQWFFGEIPLPDQTNATLTINDVQSAQVGSYHVEVRNGNRSDLSQSASLEIGSENGVFSEDKFQDVLSGVEGGPGLQSRKRPGRSNFASVSAGTLGTQVMDNLGATTEKGEPHHGGVLGGASRWFSLVPQASGLMILDTIGSGVDTVLGVYRGKNLLNLTLVARDNNGAPDGVRSLVRINAGRGTNYLVAVDGVQGAQGKIRLNWKLGTGPVIVQGPESQEGVIGGDVTFTANATGAPAVSYQWQFNGVNLTGASGPSLLLTNVQIEQTGNYRVVVSNFAGTVSSAAAALTVRQPVPLRIGGIVLSDNQVRFELSGPVGRTVRMEASTDLITWVDSGSVQLPAQSATVTQPASESRRFYRAVLLP